MSTTLRRMVDSGTITPEMGDAAERFRATLRRGWSGDPERFDLAWRASGDASAALGGLDSPAASCVLHVVGCDRSVREWAAQVGWRGPVDRRQAVGYLIAGLAILAARNSGRQS